MTEGKKTVFFEENSLEFTKTRKRVSLQLSTRSYMLTNLERLGGWSDENSVHNVKQESDEYKEVSMKKNKEF